MHLLQACKREKGKEEEELGITFISRFPRCPQRFVSNRSRQKQIASNSVGTAVRWSGVCTGTLTSSPTHFQPPPRLAQEEVAPKPDHDAEQHADEKNHTTLFGVTF
ncbi:unnamed protein product [Bubo scandiacus]